MIDAKFHGIQLDSTYVIQQIKQYEQDLQRLEQAMHAAVGHAFNMQSTNELSTVLFKELKLPVLMRTEKTNQPSTDAEALENLQGKHPVIDSLLEYKKKSKLLSTYYRALLGFRDREGAIHASFLLFGTRTGRLSSSAPNLQNIPRSAEVKNVFIARPGKFLIELDFKQIEFRLWGHYAQDAKMKQDIESGMDIHSFIASKVYNIPVAQVTKDKRTLAKTLVFGLMYGRGTKAVAAAFDIPEDEAIKIKQVFFSLYPQAAQWLEHPKFFVRTNGYVRNLFGRIRRLPGIWSYDQEIKSLAERQAVNFLPQSTAADYTFFRAVRLAPQLAPLGTRLILTVHDSLIYEAPIENAKQSLQIIFNELCTPMKTLFIFLDFDLSIGYRLGSLHEFKTMEDLDVLSTLEKPNYETDTVQPLRNCFWCAI
jgi:DNA polymerase-1